MTGTGLAVEKLHRPALRGLADRYVVTAFTDRSAEQSGRFADHSGAGPVRVAADRAAPPTGVDAEQVAAFLAPVAEHPDRTLVVGENFLYHDDLRYARALLDDGAIRRLHLMAWRHVDRLVPREGKFTGTPWPQCRGGVSCIAQIRLLCGDIMRVHDVVQAANSTIDAPSDLALKLVLAGGAIGNYTASYPEVPMPPEPDDEGAVRHRGRARRIRVGAPRDAQQLRRHHPHDSLPRCRRRLPRGARRLRPCRAVRSAAGRQRCAERGQRISSSASFAA